MHITAYLITPFDSSCENAPLHSIVDDPAPIVEPDNWVLSPDPSPPMMKVACGPSDLVDTEPVGFRGRELHQQLYFTKRFESIYNMAMLEFYSANLSPIKVHIASV